MSEGDTMREHIRTFASQFAYEPKIVNRAAFRPTPRAVVVGMGGSALAAEFLTVGDPARDLLIHRDYGLPERTPQDLRARLVVLSSYSGNTEEVLDAFAEARKRKLRTISITSGGKLMLLARRHGLPYIILPRTGVQPRMATGLMARALLSVLGLRSAFRELGLLARTLRPARFELRGKKLARMLAGFVPVIYASRRNGPVAWNWKIKMNETAKIPAFANVLPEENHNEMNGFAREGRTGILARRFAFVFLTDDRDHLRIQRRFEVLGGLFLRRGSRVARAPFSGTGVFERFFRSVVLADWVTYYLAARYRVEPEVVPIVEEFKALL